MYISHLNNILINKTWTNTVSNHEIVKFSVWVIISSNAEKCMTGQTNHNHMNLLTVEDLRNYIFKKLLFQSVLFHLLNLFMCWKRFVSTTHLSRFMWWQLCSSPFSNKATVVHARSTLNHKHCWLISLGDTQDRALAEIWTRDVFIAVISHCHKGETIYYSKMLSYTWWCVLRTSSWD